MRMRAASCRLIVFAKAPVPGEAKTRLIPALGAQGAARLHARLVTGAVATACAAAPGKVELWCAPDTQHAFFASCARRFGIALHAQCGKDIGERMHHAMAHEASAAVVASILIGSDIPDLSEDYLRDAMSALMGHDAVFGPAEDGGYGLVGLQRPQPRLFADMDWGGQGVMAETRARVRALGLSCFELPCLWDLDRPGDLARLDPALLADALKDELLLR